MLEKYIHSRSIIGRSKTFILCSEVDTSQDIQSLIARPPNPHKLEVFSVVRQPAAKQVALNISTHIETLMSSLPDSNSEVPKHVMAGINRDDLEKVPVNNLRRTVDATLLLITALTGTDDPLDYMYSNIQQEDNSTSKNDPKMFAINQMTSIAPYKHEVSMACSSPTRLPTYNTTTTFSNLKPWSLLC